MNDGTKDFLVKMNTINRHNEILELKGRISKIEGKYQEMADSYKKTLIEFDAKIERAKKKMYPKYEELETQNKKLEEKSMALLNEKKELEYERDAYKTMLDSIPSFVVKIFNRNKKLLMKGRE